MEKFSVKKPFTILVAAIIIIAMGAVSLTHLSMDLLPEIDLPYLIVITATHAPILHLNGCEELS